MSSNKQSSIDFLLKELEEIGVLNIKNCHWSDEVDVKKAIEQAVAMHKEEIIESYAIGSNDRLKNTINTNYYNETFGGEDEKQ